MQVHRNTDYQYAKKTRDKLTSTSVVAQMCKQSEVNTVSSLITPCAHARSGVKQSVLSVSQSSVRQRKLKSRHIDPHKPSKWSQTIAIANSKKLLYVYLTEVKALRFAVFRLFPTFHNYS